MLVGLNDIRQPNATISETVTKYDNVCKLYQTRFPKAVIHVGSVAPSCEKHIRFNDELEKLAKARNAPFISTQPMLEHTVRGRQAKQNVLNGFHYTRKSVRLIAKEIKSSLYGHWNRHRWNNMPAENAFHQGSHPAAAPTTHQDVRNLLAMALSYLTQI